MKTVMIVDDHPLAVMAIKILLESSGFEVVGHCDKGPAVQSMVNELNPQILVVDVDLPGMNGIDVVRRLRHQRYAGIIIVISGKNSVFYGKRAAEVKANGFVSKKNNLSSLIDAITAAENGYVYFPINIEDESESGSLSEKEKLNSLSSQELKVFHLVVKGVSNIDIASQMGVSDKTVSTYKTRMKEKLGCLTQKDVYDFSIRNDME